MLSFYHLRKAAGHSDSLQEDGPAERFQARSSITAKDFEVNDG